MSEEYYLVCHKCKRKVHVGCIGMSGFQFWSSEKENMDDMREMMAECVLDCGMENLGFAWSQGYCEDYKEYKHIESVE